MLAVGELLLVLAAGIVAAVGTGLGTVPLFLVRNVGKRWTVALWGLAAGLMASASVFGLLAEAVRKGSTWLQVGGGLVLGILLVVGAHRVVEASDYEPAELAGAGASRLLNILLVLFVHSFPEGVAIGVSFADLDLGHGIPLLGFTVPVLALVMTAALAIHNIPEGVAVGIPLKAQGSVSNARMFGLAVLTSVPQPIGAVLAFFFVRIARELLGFGYGFAAGAMLFLVFTDILADGYEEGEELPRHGLLQLGGGFGVGFVLMMPLLLIL